MQWDVCELLEPRQVRRYSESDTAANDVTDNSIISKLIKNTIDKNKNNDSNTISTINVTNEIKEQQNILSEEYTEEFTKELLKMCSKENFIKTYIYFFNILSNNNKDILVIDNNTSKLCIQQYRYFVYKNNIVEFFIQPQFIQYIIELIVVLSKDKNKNKNSTISEFTIKKNKIKNISDIIYVQNKLLTKRIEYRLLSTIITTIITTLNETNSLDILYNSLLQLLGDNNRDIIEILCTNRKLFIDVGAKQLQNLLNKSSYHVINFIEKELSNRPIVANDNSTILEKKDGISLKDANKEWGNSQMLSNINDRILLPVGSKRYYHELGWEEIYIPPMGFDDSADSVHEGGIDSDNDVNAGNSDKNTVSKDSGDKDTVNRDSNDKDAVNRDSSNDAVNRDNSNKATVNRDSSNKYTVNRDSSDKDAVNRDSSNDAVNRDNSNKVTVNRDSSDKDAVNRDSNNTDETATNINTNIIRKDIKNNIEDNRIAINTLDTIIQKSQKGIEHLNPQQSKCYKLAYETNNTLQQCAPTGSGKTNVAQLTIQREIKKKLEIDTIQNSSKNILKLQEQKIVYIAPMKALAHEICEKFIKSVNIFGQNVREWTSDERLSRKDIERTQIFIVTPEKWDLITRKGSIGDNFLLQELQLLIIDEIHQQQDTRGPVIEAIVARIHRYTEMQQRYIRIIGLSATLPNYEDIGTFIGAQKSCQLYFNNTYRPVPQYQYIISIDTNDDIDDITEKFNTVVYNKSKISQLNKRQVLVFVHTRNDTIRVSQSLLNKAKESNDNIDTLFKININKKYIQKFTNLSNDKILLQQLENGIGYQHAGQNVLERRYIEDGYRNGYIRLLVCTTTLAWGVNLPAHTVIIRGTDVYIPERGGITNQSILDILQIFGRAGRPGYENEAIAILIVKKRQLQYYLRRLMLEYPIESLLWQQLPNHLNAEIVLGTVTSIREGEIWLRYTYLYIRMIKNPKVYGINTTNIDGSNNNDNNEINTTLLLRNNAILEALKILEYNNMVKYDIINGTIYSTDLGKIASHNYIDYRTIGLLSNKLYNLMNIKELLLLLPDIQEFQQIQLREHEKNELLSIYINIKHKWFINILNPISKLDTKDKIIILLYSYINNIKINTSTLQSDIQYIIKTFVRLLNGILLLLLRRCWLLQLYNILKLNIMLNRRCLDIDHPQKQFNKLPNYDIKLLSDKNLLLNELNELNKDELLSLVGIKSTNIIRSQLQGYPNIKLHGICIQISNDVILLKIQVKTIFLWDKTMYNDILYWYIWVENQWGENILCWEQFELTYKQYIDNNKEIVLQFNFYIPLYYTVYNKIEKQEYVIVRCISSTLLHCESEQYIGLNTIGYYDNNNNNNKYILQLLPCKPLSIKSLGIDTYISLYKERFSFFNPIQTQSFFTLYHSDINTIIGAPTGSGKTILAELAQLRLWRNKKNSKAVYISPMKALAHEKYEEWSNTTNGICNKCNKLLIELTSDTLINNNKNLYNSDVYIATPEKWDGLTRLWKYRKYIQDINLIILDEVHLLGEERGSVQEAIICRVYNIEKKYNKKIRIIGLTTTLNNTDDLINWLTYNNNNNKIKAKILNYPKNSRPVPLSQYISGFNNPHYCPRMSSMNKPIYNAILTHSPTKPVLIFVSSRRQTRLTGLQLQNLVINDNQQYKFQNLNNDINKINIFNNKIKDIKDDILKHLLEFGIGIHHAGLSDNDKKIVEILFRQRYIQLCICTSTLAWGQNFPAYLVIIKGTEYYDGSIGGYVNYPITDILQMIGRAGRPQYDIEGKACIFTKEINKPFYQRFLNSPFPLESWFHKNLDIHLLAEIVQNTVYDMNTAQNWQSRTFLHQRQRKNPSYYIQDNTILIYMENDAIERNNGRIILLEQEQLECAITVLLSCNVITVLSEENDTDIIIDTIYENNAVNTDTNNTVDRNTKKKSKESEKNEENKLKYLLNLEEWQKIELKEERNNIEIFKNFYDKENINDNNTINKEQKIQEYTRQRRIKKCLNWKFNSTRQGEIATIYYINHNTINIFYNKQNKCINQKDILDMFCQSIEFTKLPVRHNEDIMNKELSKKAYYKIDIEYINTPQIKTNLQQQSRQYKYEQPIIDYETDQKIIIDSSIRILYAQLEVCKQYERMDQFLLCITFIQCLVQGAGPTSYLYNLFVSIQLSDINNQIAIGVQVEIFNKYNKKKCIELLEYETIYSKKELQYRIETQPYIVISKMRWKSDNEQEIFILCEYRKENHIEACVRFRMEKQVCVVQRQKDKANKVEGLLSLHSEYYLGLDQEIELNQEYS